MKKLIIAIFLFVVLVNSKTQTQDFSLLDYFSGEYTAYTNENVDNSVDLGFCYLSNNSVDIKSVVGESILLKNYETGAIVEKLNAEVKKTECLDDGTLVIYAYSDLIDSGIMCKNDKINLQIAVREDCVVVGWPLILGSF